MNKIILTAVIVLLFAQVSFAKSLDEASINRLKAVKALLADVEKKTMPQLIAEIEKSGNPQMNIAIKEAMARAYTDIVKEQNVQGKAKKEWLYSMVALNMAYFQFGGDKDTAGGAKNLNKLIRYKLKMYLPTGIFKQPGFHTSIE